MIANRDELLDAASDRELAEVALDCVEAGIRAVAPERATRERLALDGDILHVAGEAYDLATDYDRVVVLGGGKAAAGVVRALEAVLGDRLSGGVLAVPATDPDPDLDRVETVRAGHPTPTAGSVETGERVLAAARDADASTLVLAVVTGGGSALLAAPAGDLTLEDLRTVTDGLLAAGADIDETNAVRKHLSALKGGRLATAAVPATTVGLLVSDVTGDDPAVVASGPTAPDPTTYADARAVLDRYGIGSPAVRAHLEAGAAGEQPETPTAGDAPFVDAGVTNHVLAGARTALDAAREHAREGGFEPLVLSSRVRGEAREAALTTVAVAEEALDTGDPVAPPAVVLSGGETTVTVDGDGTGGPNGEFALRAAIELAAEGAGDDPTVAPPVTLACVDTDGRDGSADTAGALVDSGTVADRAAARAALARNDSHGHLGERGALVRTGATGTNVNDLRVLVLGD